METGEISLFLLQDYRGHLYEEEKSGATIEKYMRDIRKFYEFLGEDKNISKERVLKFKESLTGKYEKISANSILAAVNGFLQYYGYGECRVKAYKIQRQMFIKEGRELSKEEYQALVKEARKENNELLDLIMQTICSTGIRISELKSITIQTLEQGFACISCKGKDRVIMLERMLRKLLLKYCKRNKIVSGCVFVTRNGTPVNRSNVWKQMKRLCAGAGVSREKVFPHNLRHLFARTCYKKKKDIVYLADILGHSNINTTRIYTATSGKEHARLLSSLHLLI